MKKGFLGIGVVIAVAIFLIGAGCALQLYEDAVEITAADGGEITLDSGNKVTIPADSLETDGTITVKETEAVEGVDDTKYESLAKAVVLDFGEAKVKPGKTIKVDFSIEGLSRAVDSTKYAVLGYREGATEAEVLMPQEGSAEGTVTVEVWFDGTFQVVKLLTEEAVLSATKPYIGSWVYDVREEIDYPSFGLPEKNEFTFTDKKINFYAEYFFENDSDVAMYAFYSDCTYTEKDKEELSGGDVYILDIFFGEQSGFMGRETPDGNFSEVMNTDNQVTWLGMYFMDSGTVYLVPSATLIDEDAYDEEAYQTAKNTILGYINNDIAGATGEPDLISDLIAKLTKK